MGLPCLDFLDALSPQPTLQDPPSPSPDFEAGVQAEQASGLWGVRTRRLSCTLQEYLDDLEMGTGSLLRTADFWMQQACTRWLLGGYKRGSQAELYQSGAASSSSRPPEVRWGCSPVQPNFCKVHAPDFSLTQELIAAMDEAGT